MEKREEVLAECWNSNPTIYVLAFDTVIADPLRCAKSADDGEINVFLAACRFPAGRTVLLMNFIYTMTLNRTPTHPSTQTPHEYTTVESAD